MPSVFGAIYGFFISCFAFVFQISSIFAPVVALVSPGKNSFYEDWNKNQEFVETYAARIDKDPEKDFVILNITDVQLSFPNAYSDEGQYSEKIIDKLVTEQKPDLITLTGDNAWCITAYLRIIKVIDSYDIPWAPIMGNHDGGGCIDEFFTAYWLSKAENCLFKFGPKSMGYGNYIINIYENDEIIHTLFMMDTHSDASDTDAGKINYAEDGSSGYDHLWANQLEWYEWAINGISDIAGHNVESTVFMHIPCYEFRLAQAENTEVKVIDETTTYYIAKNDGDFGENHEGICAPKGNNGFFALVKKLDSTKNIIVGHDHVNSLSTVYDDVRLTYALKCGSGCYWEDTMSGGTIITINSNGNVNDVHHEYVYFEY